MVTVAQYRDATYEVFALGEDGINYQQISGLRKAEALQLAEFVRSLDVNDRVTFWCWERGVA